MADEPMEQLQGKTPLMSADKPNIDELAKKGRSGLLKTVPDTMPPGSEIANMAVMGYDVEKVYEGRGVLEAASLKVQLADDELAMRCNLVCVENGILKNHSAGHISTEEAKELIEYLQEQMGSQEVTLYPGVSYRHLLVMKGGNKQIKCTPPHDKPGTPYEKLLITAASAEASGTAATLNGLIRRSMELLETHPVNIKRKAEGKDPANAIWPWSPGYRPQMSTLKEMYGVKKAAVISAVDLLHGIGIYAGMDVIPVEGATGLYNTNYEGKVQAALEAMKDYDLVYLHIEAPDEAGHEGDYKLKIRTIEDLDKRVVKTIYEETSKMDTPVTLALLPDHPTPCNKRTHTSDPVPFIIYEPGAEADNVDKYDEDAAAHGNCGLLKGNQFIKELLNIDYK
ncbi:MAG: cofactor-independent phosphoglycerate mutase [bacterium]|nr:cofactor-independent phosphoglycerate mutase [bacterium]